ncbi:MAG: hypothetical protein AAFW95_14390, partial [Cyanobacteria bacterium J06638_6]
SGDDSKILGSMVSPSGAIAGGQQLVDEHLKQQQKLLRGAIDAVWIDELLATCDRAARGHH